MSVFGIIDTTTGHYSYSDIERIFSEAISNKEFLAYYQPKVLLTEYKLAGAEALCRWQHDGKLVPPFDFIPVLEESELICILDFYMLELVCKDIRRWLDEKKNVVKVSVNLSRRNIGTPNLLERIVEIIDKYEVPHEYIQIELLESATDIDSHSLKLLVKGLHEKSISTAVDDFGTGYSSLNLIRRLPWNEIKIDKSLLPEDQDKDTEKYTMFKHLLSMFYDMGLNCIVEGVETLEQIRLLKANNCFMAQGFYFDKPLPVNEFETRMAELK